MEEKRKWLFNENVRLEEMRKQLEADRRALDDEYKVVEIQKEMLDKQKRKNALLSVQLQNQKSLFDKQWQILEEQIRQLAIDKEKFAREKTVFRDEIFREARRQFMKEYENKQGFFSTARESGNIGSASGFYKGVTDSVSLRKRYKQLLKIFHPDNMNGDGELIKDIMDEYERLKKMFM